MQDNECGRLHLMVSSNMGNMERTVGGERELKTRLGTCLRRVRERRTLFVRIGAIQGLATCVAGCGTVIRNPEL